MTPTLPRSGVDRITLKKHFEHIFNWGNALEGDAMRFQFCTPYATSPKVAFVAPKRIGNAVKRNHAKRVLRELFRQTEIYSRIQYDVVFIAKTSINKRPFTILHRQFEQLTERLLNGVRP